MRYPARSGVSARMAIPAAIGMIGIGLLFLRLALFPLHPQESSGRLEEKWLSATIFAMGGIPVEITLFGETKTSFADQIQAATERIDHLEDFLSSFRPASPVSRLNRMAGKDGMVLDAEVLEVLSAGFQLHRETGGAYEMTIGPLVSLWRQAGDRGVLPSDKAIQTTLGLVGSEKVEFDRATGWVKLPLAGMALDLSGLGKGYIVDRTVELLRRRGSRRGMVNAGGDLLAFAPPGTPPFQVGIRDPEGGPADLLGRFPLRDGGVATSGNYEKFFKINGRRTGHILDPRSGRPAEGTLSVTVLTSTAMRADGLATGLFILGPEAGANLVNSLPGVEAIILYRTPAGQERWVSEGWPEINWFPGAPSRQGADEEKAGR